MTVHSTPVRVSCTVTVIPFPTGAATLNARDVPHAGFKVVGDKTLKMLTVHIVDKGKPVLSS
jgi:hypothetical protein